MSQSTFETEQEGPTGQQANKLVKVGLGMMRDASEEGDLAKREAAIESTTAAIKAGSQIKKGGSDGPEMPSPTGMVGVSDRSKK